MNSLKTRLLAAGLVCVLTGFGPAPEAMTLCEPSLEGVWQLEEFIYRDDRNFLPAAERRLFTLVIKPRKIEVCMRGQALSDFTFDYQAIPGQPAFKLRNEKGKNIGIYQLDGSRLTIAVVDDQQPCPTSFPKDPAVLLRLRRIK